jgi:hypothetical protein
MSSCRRGEGEDEEKRRGEYEYEDEPLYELIATHDERP